VFEEDPAQQVDLDKRRGAIDSAACRAALSVRQLQRHQASKRGLEALDLTRCRR
jgi:hypothetical protein